jgi:hypothetical protein
VQGPSIRADRYDSTLKAATLRTTEPDMTQAAKNAVNCTWDCARDAPTSVAGAAYAATYENQIAKDRLINAILAELEAALA